MQVQPFKLSCIPLLDIVWVKQLFNGRMVSIETGNVAVQKLLDTESLGTVVQALSHKTSMSVCACEGEGRPVYSAKSTVPLHDSKA